ncbi:GABA permease [Burkholderia oklahomensis]|uniref:GABA permease n=1 Tax=Burkholderia oklahomensis TaxID=342113 RepID=A0AAI8FPW3_9BURK|nr:GABA permease [Burkholderia oklahomensis]AIO68345.1 GABA permease [Burkholderia oklahomensis]AOI41160.1 GABA permease [Burkholderia oklahomensis EO147]KUY66176.1 GABA permease [Burkholderia oklahomensis EO147]QPS35875.1 GABA permease [Burkholderia oklahomensis]
MKGSQTGLGTGLKQRHVTMLSIAGVIGAGLFVGSGHAIAEAGPAALIAYAIAGLLVVLVMRMLGEMAVAQPDSGSFSTYADRAIGHWAGFTIGWLYWWFWVLVIPIEATAAATILNAWFPGVATWIFALGITSVLTLTNLFSVKNYGEFEFWFALIKVVAIVVFLAIGGAAIVGLLPGSSVSGVARLVNAGGFMPNGIGAVLAAMLTTMFSFLGTEIVTIAAAESEQPERQIVRATNSVIWRISLFYLGSIFVVAALVPWNDALLPTHGSYQRAMELIGVPHAKAIIDVIVLVSVASCLNSALYTASRMIFSLSTRGDAPAFLRRTDASGTPRAAVLASTAFGFLTVIANYVMPEQVFGFLLATSGAIALLVYLVIAISQLRMRSTLDATGERPPLRMWCFPWLTWAVILFICGVLVVMLLREDHRMEIAATAVLALAVVAASWMNRRARGAEASASAPPRVSANPR